MGWKDKVAKSVWGKATEAYKGWKQSKSTWVKDKTGTITGVKPHTGKVPWYVGASPNTPESRARIVKTHYSLKRSDKIDKAVKDIEKGKKTLKHMEATGQAKELKNYKGEGTGVYHKKGFDK
tara:strand:+ start:376 stop:741 length:366 start_codon:yes stop_codon:yes gene_type:complete